jgi:uncharacterized protein
LSRVRGALLAVLLAASLVPGAAARARPETPADIENPRTTRGEWVADHAGVLSAAAERELNTIAGDLQRAHGAELAVVTIHDSGERTPRQFATELFNLWGVGQRGRDNGVLVLIVVDPHRIEVETGYGAEAVLPDARVGRILDRFVIPRYRVADVDGGTIAGARELARVLSGEERWTDRLPTPEEALPWTALGGGAFAFLAGVLIRERLRTRCCPKCHRRMRLLARAQEMAYLSAVENLEDEIHAVAHTVWRCDGCQTCHIEHRRLWLSGYGDCPKCHRRTLEVSSRTLVEPTYERSGSKEIRKGCLDRACGFQSVEQKRIPRLEEPTGSSSDGSGSDSGSSGGSSGGSFGGGSSGGGGAGRSW